MGRPLSPIRALVRALEQTPAPVYVLDAQRQIVFVNAALADWLGLPRSELLGRRCDYHTGSEDRLEAACAGLCPPPEAFSGALPRGTAVRLPTDQRPGEQRDAAYVRLWRGEGAASESWLLVVVAPKARSPQELAPQTGTPLLSSSWLHEQLWALRQAEYQRYALAQWVGQSPAIVRARELARLAAEARQGVLVLGPAGSGREHLARTIHALRSGGRTVLMPLACPLLDAEGMQAALTSLLRAHPAEAPCPPTALLLEADQLSEASQRELAEFLRLPQVELLTLATARRSLVRLAARGRFLPELAYRLSTLTISLPSLARRREDIPLLAQHFLEQRNRQQGRQLGGFAAAVLECLVSLPWPGNLDQLRRAVEEAAGRAAGPQVLLGDLPDWVHLAKHHQAHPPAPTAPIALDALLADVEKEALLRALDQAHGNKSRAAELLGISRGRLLRRLAHFGLIAPAPREPIIFEPLDEQP
jgi:transcriptional regulator of acetoin/glycerol metabolism